MSMLSPIYTNNGVSVSNLTATEVQLTEASTQLRNSLPVPVTATGVKIPIVKPNDSRLVLHRRTELLRNVDYMETQIGRLAKMARDMRAEILLLTTE